LKLDSLGIGIYNVTHQLGDEGVDIFSKSFDKLMETLEKAVKK
jgi:hypothetical protein